MNKYRVQVTVTKSVAVAISDAYAATGEARRNDYDARADQLR